MSHGGDDELHEEHEEHVNHEAWVIPYADLLTLLMAMFIALFAMSTVDISKFKALAIGFNEALGGGKLDAGVGGTTNKSPVFGQGNEQWCRSTGQPSLSRRAGLPKGTTLAQVLEALASKNGNNTAKSQEKASARRRARTRSRTRPRRAGSRASCASPSCNNGLLVTLVTDKVLFDSGQFDAATASRSSCLNIVAEALKAVDNPIQVTGYTDTQPFNGPHGNDILSFERALAVKDYLVGAGILDSRMKFPVGAGPRDPIDAEHDDGGAIAQPASGDPGAVEAESIRSSKDNALDNSAATPTTTPISNPTGRRESGRESRYQAGRVSSRVMPEKITMQPDGSLSVPDEPIIPFVEGDGTGVDIWPAAQLVMDAAAREARQEDRVEGSARGAEGVRRDRLVVARRDRRRRSATT